MFRNEKIKDSNDQMTLDESKQVKSDETKDESPRVSISTQILQLIHIHFCFLCDQILVFQFFKLFYSLPTCSNIEIKRRVIFQASSTACLVFIPEQQDQHRSTCVKTKSCYLRWRSTRRWYFKPTNPIL